MTFAKRVFDLFWAALGLLVLCPVFAFVALCIKLEDGGPVFFRQTRLGRGGKPFQLWKFRTMVVDAAARGGPLTVGQDPRVTRVGRRLRGTKIDELPQLVNVLWGEMSLVGPRPEVERYVRLYSDEERKVLELTPGITDPASIRFRRESDLLAAASDPEGTYIREIMPEKIALNLSYATRATVWADFLVILKTFLSLAY